MKDSEAHNPSTASRRAIASGWRVLALIACGLAIGVVLTLLAVHHLKRPAAGSPIPAAITQQADFVIFYPQTPWNVDKTSVRYDKIAKVVSLSASGPAGKIVMNQQTAPSQFTDIPQYYPTLLAKLNQYSQFGVSAGTVYLAHPSELNGGQTAVMVSQGTLLFARPDHNLSDGQWRDFFKTFGSAQ